MLIGNSSESDLDPLFPVPVLKEVIPSAFATGILKEFGPYNMTIADMIQLSFLLPTKYHTSGLSNASLSSPTLSLMYTWEILRHIIQDYLVRRL